MVSYLAWNSCFSRDDTFGLFQQFCVQGFRHKTSTASIVEEQTQMGLNQRDAFPTIIFSFFCFFIFYAGRTIQPHKFSFMYCLFFLIWQCRVDIVKLVERKVVGGGDVFLNLLIDSHRGRIYLKMKPTSLFHSKIQNSAFQF